MTGRQEGRQAGKRELPWHLSTGFAGRDQPSIKAISGIKIRRRDVTRANTQAFSTTDASRLFQGLCLNLERATRQRKNKGARLRVIDSLQQQADVLNNISKRIPCLIGNNS